MFASAIAHLKKNFRNIKRAVTVDPLFSRYDKYQLDLINRSTNIKKHVRLKPKGWKHGITIRQNFVDKDVVFYVLQEQYHLPPVEATFRSNPVILDLGSNIGLTVAHLKNQYPLATIIGYEMNQENYLLAVANTQKYPDVQIVNTAVWIEDATVSYATEANSDSYSIVSQTEKSRIGQQITVPCLQLSTIFKNHDLDYVDYLKMDIEGAEESILRAADLSWMQKVGAMNIEMHLDKEDDLTHFISIITQQGFKVWKDNKHWSSIFAVRDVVL